MSAGRKKSQKFEAAEDTFNSLKEIFSLFWKAPQSFDSSIQTLVLYVSASALPGIDLLKKHLLPHGIFILFLTIL